MNFNYSVVIATRNRPEFLKITLESLACQTRPPHMTILADSSDDHSETQAVMAAVSKLEYIHLRLTDRSAARQRNAGAAQVYTELISFLDDDVKLCPDVMERLVDCFEGGENASTCGVAARVKGMQHHTPGFLMWLYYRIQAGYGHPDYGAKLFGPGLNCLPCYHDEDPEKIPADWLNSTCVMYRTDHFRKVRFPDWDGYSFMEDAWLSAHIGREGNLFFLKSALYEHYAAPGDHKADVGELARMRIKNQRKVAREILGMSPLIWMWKLLLHRIFVSYVILRRRAPDWLRELAGVWF